MSNCTEFSSDFDYYLSDKCHSPKYAIVIVRFCISIHYITSLTVPPSTVTITSTPITTSYYAGTPLNLTCTVQLIPQVDTTVIFNSLWTGPGGQISSGVGRVSLSSGVNQTTVQFYPLNTTDTGVYNCSVSVSASGQQYVDTSIAVSSSNTSITVKGQ